MVIKAEYNRNGAQVWYSGHLKRIIDVKHDDSFHFKLSPAELNLITVDPEFWTTTVVEVGANESEFFPSDEIDFVGNLKTAGNENDGINTQLIGEVFKFDSAHHSYFGMRMKINDVTQIDAILGFCIVDTSLVVAMTDGVYFRTADGAATLTFVAEKGSSETETASIATLVDDTLIELEFYWDGLKLEAFVDGVSVYYDTPANLPDTEELRLSLAILTGEAAEQTMKIQKLECWQWGRA